MHAARLEHSPRLQRTLAYLLDGLWHSTRDIVHGAKVCAVNSCVDELRVGGFDIRCERRGQYWYYRLCEEGEVPEGYWDAMKEALRNAPIRDDSDVYVPELF